MRTGSCEPPDLPSEVAFKLTNRCDLRCSHCYQWSEGGYHRQLPAGACGDLDPGIIERVLEATRTSRSNVFLWGGEPLVYRYWERLVDLLVADPRWTALCTNGTLIEKRLEGLLKLSGHLEVSISLDGFAAEHDAVRGKGSFDRAVRGLRLLAGQKRSGAFQGELTVNFLLTDGMVPRMAPFVSWLEGEGVNTVYVSFPWFLSGEAVARMDDYFRRHFGWEQVFAPPSWHSYSYGLSPELVDALAAGIEALARREGTIKLRYNPELSSAELLDFIKGSDKPAQGKTRCQAIATRMDVFPDGQVVSCKFFPELRMGSLADDEVKTVWHGQRYTQLRETLACRGLMPVCAKCNLLYTRGA
jgi:radical SAM protein with 4Fe4S-binding SPASM domain